jgi:hypothetical protein
MRIAVIDLASNLVVNVAHVEDGDGSTEPDGFLHIESNSANIGDSWDGTNIIPKPEPEPEPRV